MGSAVDRMRRGTKVAAIVATVAVTVVAVAFDNRHGLSLASTLVVLAEAGLVATLVSGDIHATITGTLDARDADAEARDREIVRLGVEIADFGCKIGIAGDRPEKGHVTLRERSIRIEEADGTRTDVTFRHSDIEPDGRLSLMVYDSENDVDVRLEMRSAAAATEIKDAYDKATGRVYTQ